MNNRFDSATDAEDAYYDAIDENDLEKMMSVWADSDDVACLLPMQPICRGTGPVRELWRSLFEDQQIELEITVNHLHWIEQGDLAIHLLEEVVTTSVGSEAQPPIYASNIFHCDDQGWRLLLHINSPTPPPAAVLPPIPGQR